MIGLIRTSSTSLECDKVRSAFHQVLVETSKDIPARFITAAAATLLSFVAAHTD
jgi:hypothetical protein